MSLVYNATEVVAAAIGLLIAFGFYAADEGEWWPEALALTIGVALVLLIAGGETAHGKSAKS